MKTSILLGATVIIIGVGLTAFVVQTPLEAAMPNFHLAHRLLASPDRPLTGRRRPASPSGATKVTALYGKEYLLLQEGKDLYKAGDLRGAEKKMLASLAAEPSFDTHKEPQAEQMLGRIYLREGKYKEAIPHLKACLPEDNDDIRGLGLVIAYARLGNYAQAKRYYNGQVLQTLRSTDSPGIDDLHSLEASAVLECGISDFYHADRDSALRHLLAAERLAPNVVTTEYYTGRVLFDKKRYAEAAPRFKKVVTSPRGAKLSEARQYLSDAKAKAAATRKTKQ